MNLAGDRIVVAVEIEVEVEVECLGVEVGELKSRWYGIVVRCVEVEYLKLEVGELRREYMTAVRWMELEVEY